MHPGYIRAPELLPVPRPDRIRPEQEAGTRCVWCRRTRELPVDLGPRLSTHTGAVRRWRPRACQPCAAREAARVFTIHTDKCARCVHRDWCPDARALYDLSIASRSRPAARRPDR
jgi:hypothetical protein